MSACEKCWEDAHNTADVAEEYRRLMLLRAGAPCTPEQQAGRDAKVCPRCKRPTLHQYTGECMTRCGYNEASR